MSGRKRRRGSAVPSEHVAVRRRQGATHVLTGDNARAVAEHFKRYYLGAVVASLTGAIDTPTMRKIDMLAKHLHPDRVRTISYSLLVILGGLPRVRMGREMVGPLPDVMMFG